MQSSQFSLLKFFNLILIEKRKEKGESVCFPMYSTCVRKATKKS